MKSARYHVGCGRRVVESEHPEQWLFDCPAHGVVDWSETRFDVNLAMTTKAPQPKKRAS